MGQPSIPRLGATLSLRFSEKSLNPKWRIQDDGCQEIMMLFLRHITSSFHVLEIKRNIFGRAINSSKIFVIALILQQLQGEDLNTPFPLPSLPLPPRPVRS